ncbi:MAG: M1 family aminopeptidase, partial [Ignavibacteriaceae bacterium]
IAEFFWELGAMEHQTITGLASNMIGGKGYFLDVLVHELAHHWWGDAVGPKYWKDIWLNEGFATYSEALFYEFRSGKSALQSTMLNKKQRNFRGSLENPGNFLFTSTVYDKGAWVLHMLRWELGDRTFFEILRKYFEKYKYSNASTVDFENVCESVSNKDLTKFFDQWIKAVGEIELKYNWNVEEGSSGNFSTNISLHQDQKEYDEYHFSLEIALKFENGKSEIHKVEFSKKSVEVSFKSSSEPVDVILDPNNWLLMYAEKE